MTDTTSAPDRQPVSDWATDYDIFDPEYVRNPFAVWDDLRDRCPVAHTDRWGGSWLPTKYEDVTRIARDIERFPSGGGIAVIPPVGLDGASGTGPAPVAILPYGVPPISADPPLHTWTRRLILPWMSPQKTASYEPMTRALCDKLIDGFIASGQADVAADYAQQIPVRVIAHILGVPPELSDTFTGWVRDVLEFAYDPERRRRGVMGVVGFFQNALADRRMNPSDDLISELLHTEVDGAPIEESVIIGMCSLLLIAGVDTTWSAIGSSLWHLASHPDDRRRLVERPELMDTAVEEFLRAYSPVTMARRLLEDVEYEGCPMKAGERVLMNFPGANRDPEVFENADQVIIDRQLNRHVAFGAGIHRCAGSNLARMELRVAIETFIARIPEFELIDPSSVTWAGGQVRGPREARVRF
ncbi:MAG: cytochrome P450 [Acidimicrobiales bacterium mtb01]|nr:cytochrome P450 [Actinomycetota bacterium]TEX45287.1 MAG: cytochrome P450 [Acidimicrobiales bacterium mtb01]